jgi:hypothetical protein
MKAKHVIIVLVICGVGYLLSTMFNKKESAPKNNSQNIYVAKLKGELSYRDSIEFVMATQIAMLRDSIEILKEKPKTVKIYKHEKTIPVSVSSSKYYTELLSKRYQR